MIPKYLLLSWGHVFSFQYTIVWFYDSAMVRCTAVRFRFSRMRGTWRSQVPCIRENRKRTAVHRHCKLGKKVVVSSKQSWRPCRPPWQPLRPFVMSAVHTRCPLRPSWLCRSPRPSSRPFLMSAACIRRPWQPSRPFQTADGLFWWPRRVWLSILDLNKAKIEDLSIKPLWSNGYESGLSPRRSGFDSPPELFPFNFQFLFIIEDKLVRS